jgi:hypothetical protein
MLATLSPEDQLILSEALSPLERLAGQATA